VVMSGGRIIADGDTAELMSATTFLAPQTSRVLGDRIGGIVTVEAGRAALREVLARG